MADFDLFKNQLFIHFRINRLSQILGELPFADFTGFKVFGLGMVEISGFLMKKYKKVIDGHDIWTNSNTKMKRFMSILIFGCILKNYNVLLFIHNTTCCDNLESW